MERLVLSEDQIVKICQRLAHEIDDYLKDEEGIPVVMGVMNGALPFMYELIKHIEHPIQLDTIKVSSYEGESSTGKVKVERLPDMDLKGRKVILVEDIIDTGVTMNFLKDYIKSTFKPKEMKICVLVKRENIRMQYDEKADFVGITTDEQKYIVGFGFDYHGLFRNTPYVFVPSIKDLKNWESYFVAEENKQKKD